MNLEHIIKTLDQEEKVELARMLHQDLNVPNINLLRSTMNMDQKVLCPHCGTDDIYGHGAYKGRKRYKCKDCNKTFNDFTGTAISGIKKVDKFQEYIGLVVESVTIRKAASKIGVNMKTFFDWRHKLLSSLAPVNGQAFFGIVECDDKQLNINNNKLPETYWNIDYDLTGLGNVSCGSENCLVKHSVLPVVTNFGFKVSQFEKE